MPTKTYIYKKIVMYFLFDTRRSMPRQKCNTQSLVHSKTDELTPLLNPHLNSGRQSQQLV
jgi:hypothetical protein